MRCKAETAAAPKVLFQLTVNGASVGIFENEPYTRTFPHATAANVQMALEQAALEGTIPAEYGAGNMIVSGQGAEGVPPLVVRSVNGAGHRPLQIRSKSDCTSGRRRRLS